MSPWSAGRRSAGDRGALSRLCSVSSWGRHASGARVVCARGVGLPPGGVVTGTWTDQDFETHAITARACAGTFTSAGDASVDLRFYGGSSDEVLQTHWRSNPPEGYWSIGSFEVGPNESQMYSGSTFYFDTCTKANQAELTRTGDTVSESLALDCTLGTHTVTVPLTFEGCPVR